MTDERTSTVIIRFYPRIISGIALLVMLGVMIRVAEAQQEQVTFPDKPPTGTYFVDEAGLISQADGQAINQVAADLWRDEAIPILAVTITSLSDHNASGYSIEQYAFELFNHWGIGSERRNYGMLLLVSEGDRKARIELGAAWGHDYDVQAQQVMDTRIIPQFKEERFSEGILLGVEGIDSMARRLSLPRPEIPWGSILIYLGLFGLIIAIIYSLFKSGRKGWAWALIGVLGAILLFVLTFAVGGGGSSGGGSSGGGFSGGGGGSGSW